MQRAKTIYQNQFSVFDWIGGSQVNNPGIRSRPRGLKEAVKVLRPEGGAGRHHKTEPVNEMCRVCHRRILKHLWTGRAPSGFCVMISNLRF